ncbi:hypothetical protein BD410DRAFT_791421 [Rickenella mellea]|uniref:Uncharacterized protein n=1 Tax=Rickenella mellea TaxID=50990 RepID=A0A4Y7PXC1_9AGAM|nr:hypothetical protein BD410DRAFT_791421 [Rickenella mellea]
MVRSMKFCCCLPVRLGVFVLSLLTAACAGVVAAGLIYVLIKDEDRIRAALTKAQWIAVIVLAAISSLITLFAIGGFIGSLVRSRRLVSGYSTVLNLHLGFSIGAGIFYIITIFRENKEEFIKRCINGSTDKNVIDICNKATTAKFVSLGFLVVSWLIELYCCIIVARYVIQLEEEADDKYRHLHTRSAPSAGGFQYSHARNESQMALNAPPLGGYPYTDAAHSHGHTAV